jgi:beta-glucanase (GH16 family)
MINLFGAALMLLSVSCDTSEDKAEVFPVLLANNVARFEGNQPGEFSFEVRLEFDHSKPVSVDYYTQDLTAKAGEDYISSSGTLQFQPGTLSQTIKVGILADTLREEDENFEIIFSNPVNASLSSFKITGSIRNDDTFLPLELDGYITPSSYPGWNLVWEDDFKQGIDPANWKFQFGDSGWGNNEWQHYTDRPQNAFVSEGVLVIEARKENFNGSDYTSARMITAGLKEFQYGRVDIRAKLPEGKGIWPALWMLGSDFWTTGWPGCGEIDIMEIIGSEPSRLHGTVHWDNGGSYASYGNHTDLPSGKKFSDEFHVFSLIWDEEQIRWLLDDVQFNAIDIRPSGLSEFHQPYFFLFNVAVGGNWPGYPDNTTVFPQRMMVDYIRVFQKS